MSRHHPILLLLLILLSLAFAPGMSSPLAAPPTTDREARLDAVLTRVKEREKTLKTVTGRFKQTRKTRLLKEPLHSEGELYFDSEGKMLLKVTAPSPFVVRFMDNFLTLYDPVRKESQERYLGPGNLFKRIFGLGATVEDLKRQFSITLVSDTHPDGFHLRLEPREEGSLRGRIASIETVVRPDEWLPAWVSILEAKGDQTILRLEYTSFNEPLPPGIFDIPLPAGSGDGLK